MEAHPRGARRRGQEAGVGKRHFQNPNAPAAQAPRYLSYQLLVVGFSFSGLGNQQLSMPSLPYLFRLA